MAELEIVGLQMIVAEVSSSIEVVVCRRRSNFGIAIGR